MEKLKATTAADVLALFPHSLYRSEDPTERTGAPFLEWAAAAENLRLQVLE